MVVRMRSTRSHTGNRRSHHALKKQAPVACECGQMRISHRACPHCGRYKGRVVIDMAAKVAARGKRREERMAKAGRSTGDKNEVQK